MIKKIRILIILILLISGVFINGCVQEKTSTVPTEIPTIHPTTTIPAIDTEIYCISNETGIQMTHSEAWDIAENSECVMEGSLKDSSVCNEYTGTWWIDLEPLIEKPGCNPACVVNVNTKTTEINWRCTGALPPNSSDF
ncbi:MAG: hypothetical protein IBX40_08975 [Methanosarcinales archaeon]|nr:hypothetical protein [Methanosarcinales archaeon]